MPEGVEVEHRVAAALTAADHLAQVVEAELGAGHPAQAAGAGRVVNWVVARTL